jgi:hypothetical protein
VITEAGPVEIKHKEAELPLLRHENAALPPRPATVGGPTGGVRDGRRGW